MSLRQAWVRIRALPYGSPLHLAIEKAQEAAELDQQARDIDDVLDMIRKG
jgi:hypothetical protein